MQIACLDHLVLTVSNLEESCDFYHRILGIEILTHADGRKSLNLGPQLIKLHPVGADIQPKAAKPTPGSADFCLISRTPLADVQAHFKRCGVAIIEGPVVRQGANGKLLSLYIFDPDDNLVEISQPADPNYQL